MTLEHEWDQRSVQFPLDERSVVLDIGAYKGRWSKEIASRYHSRVYAFEPQAWAFAIAAADLEEFPSVLLFNFGLGVETGRFEMEEFETDGASFVLGFSGRQQSGEGHLIAIDEWLDQAKIEKIDLVMMNIEAYEFKLIPYMIKNGIMQKVKYFMAQFHPRTYEQQDEFDVLKQKMADIGMEVFFDYGIMLMCWKAKEEELIHVVAQQMRDALKQEPLPPVTMTTDPVETVPEKPRARRGGRRKKTE